MRNLNWHSLLMATAVTGLWVNAAGAQAPENWVSEVPAGRGYFAQVEALWLKRDASDASTLATLNSTGSPGRVAVLASEDVDFDFETGIRVLAGMMLDGATQLEAEYFGIQEFDGNEAVLVRPAGPFLLNSVFTVLNQTPSFYRADGETELHNGELNLRRRGCLGRFNHSVMVGFRYMQLNDDLSLNVAAFPPTVNPALPGAPLATETTAVEAENHIFALQVGGDIGYQWDYFRLTASVEGFVYGNYYQSDARNTVNDPSGFFLTQAGGGTFRNSTHEEQDTTAGVGAQIGLDAAVSLTQNIILHAGYHVLAISDVALGSEQLPTVRLSPARGARIFNPERDEELGSLFFHGPSAGLELRW